MVPDTWTIQRMIGDSVGMKRGQDYSTYHVMKNDVMYWCLQWQVNMAETKDNERQSEKSTYDVNDDGEETVQVPLQDESLHNLSCERMHQSLKN